MALPPTAPQGHAKGSSAASASRACQALNAAAALCETAFETADPSRCQGAARGLADALARAVPRALVSPEAARFCAMLAALMVHPSDACREAAVSTCARELDVALLLRMAPRNLSCANALDPARRLQVVENILRSARILLASDKDALERCRMAGGVITAVEVWRQGARSPDVLREAAQLVLLFMPAHAKAIVHAGGIDIALASWQRLSQTHQQAAGAGAAAGTPRKPAGLNADRQNNALLLQVNVELLLCMAPHAAAPQKFFPVTPLAVQALAGFYPTTVQHPVGPQRMFVLLLQLLTKMAHDTAMVRELARLNVHQTVLEMLENESLTRSAASRRAIANAWVHIVIGTASEARRQLSGAPRLLCNGGAGPASTMTEGLLGVRGGAGVLARLPEALPPELGVRNVHRLPVPEAPLCPGAACAAALRRHLPTLQGLVWGTAQATRTIVYPPPLGDGGPSGAGGQFLRFDASFECANLRHAVALGPFEYELQLAVDLCNAAHCQWFYWRVAGTMQGVAYTFHLVNLGKPTSLFEEGAQPVMLSRRRCIEENIGWTREGHDIAYYANGGVLANGKPSHTISFSLVFPYADDDVFIAHFFPYSYADHKRDVARWSARSGTAGTCAVSSIPATAVTSVATSPTSGDDSGSVDIANGAEGISGIGGGGSGNAGPSEGDAPSAGGAPDDSQAAATVGDDSEIFERRVVLHTPAGFPVEAFRVGAAPGTKPRAVLIARAHPGESPGSWVMRGACDFLLTDQSEDARVCRSTLSWFLVPMLNPDGVVAGNTRTNAAGVDQNRHHHDDAAPETVALRQMLAEAAAEDSVGPPIAFVDVHGHSRRRGVFLMGNAGASARLPALLARRTPFFDLAGSAFYHTSASGRDAGVGRVAMASRGCPHSFTLEASFGMMHDGTQQLSPMDLESVGRALCLALCALTEPEQGPAMIAPAVTGEAADD